MLNQQEMTNLKEKLKIRSGIVAEKLDAANREGKLFQFLRSMGIEDYIPEEVNPRSRGKLLILGVTKIKKTVILAIAKKFSIPKNKIEFCDDYDSAKRYNTWKLRYNMNYAAVIVGAVPHSTYGAGDYGSMVEAMKSIPGFPPVYFNEAITKSSFEALLKYISANNIILV